MVACSHSHQTGSLPISPSSSLASFVDVGLCGEGSDEVTDHVESDPEGLWSGFSGAFAGKEAAERGDHADHFLQFGWLGGRCGAVADDPGGVPFFAIEKRFAGEVGAVSAEREHVLNAPGDDEVNGDGDLQTFEGFELEIFDAAFAFEADGV